MKKNGYACRIGLLLLFLAWFPLSASAEIPEPADRWTFAVQPYLWLPSISGSLSYGISEGGGPNVDIDTTNILESLNFALMFTAEARKKRWSLWTDVIYLDLESSGSQVKSINFSGPGGQVTVPATLDAGTNVEIEGIEWGLAGAYTVAQGKISVLDVLVGFRYFTIEAKTDWNLSGTVSGPGPGQSFARTGSISKREDLWDGIIGIRGRVGLGSGKWGIPYYFDIGTGSSDLTLQGAAGIQYRFSWIDLSLLYRYLYYDMEEGELLQDVGIGGPMIGVNFRF